MSRNVELKARDRDSVATLRPVLAAGAVDSGILEQRDTHYAAPYGRLKLLRREQIVWLHLDDVRWLGPFLEIEAVSSATSDLEREHDQVRRLVDALRIAPVDVVAAGYADLLLR